jgi:hypothetical protein
MTINAFASVLFVLFLVFIPFFRAHPGPSWKPLGTLLETYGPSALGAPLGLSLVVPGALLGIWGPMVILVVQQSLET